MKSTRLPHKLIRQIFGREIIRWMIDRLKRSGSLSTIALCTSTNPQDDILEQIAKEEDIECFRGAEDDVIQRLYSASCEFGLNYALNITGDCPLVSLEYIDETIAEYQRSHADLIRSLDLPHGFFNYGLDIGALERVCEIKDSENTEVWGKYFTDSGLFKVVDLRIPEKLIRPDYRLTLDYPEDLEFFNRIFDFFGKETYKQSMSTLIEFLDKNPQIVDINKHCKEKYRQRWEQQNKARFK